MFLVVGGSGCETFTGSEWQGELSRDAWQCCARKIRKLHDMREAKPNPHNIRKTYVFYSMHLKHTCDWKQLRMWPWVCATKKRLLFHPVHRVRGEWKTRELQIKGVCLPYSQKRAQNLLDAPMTFWPQLAGCSQNPISAGLSNESWNRKVESPHGHCSCIIHRNGRHGRRWLSGGFKAT